LEYNHFFFFSGGSRSYEEEGEINLSSSEKRMLGIPEHEKVNHGILRKYGVSESEIRRLTGKGK